MAHSIGASAASDGDRLVEKSGGCRRGAMVGPIGRMTGRMQALGNRGIGA